MPSLPRCRPSSWPWAWPAASRPPTAPGKPHRHPPNPDAAAEGGTRQTPPPEATGAPGGEASLQPLLKPDDQILAFIKRHDLTGDGQDHAVAIVRHANADASGNPCELLVLQRANKAWSVSDRSPQAVDCLYNDVARNAKRLDDNLTLKSQQIVYVNQQARRNVAYTLKYDTAKKAWYLAETSSTTPVENPQSGKMDVFRGTARYPADIAWTPIAQIDAEQLPSPRPTIASRASRWRKPSPVATHSASPP